MNKTVRSGLHDYKSPFTPALYPSNKSTISRMAVNVLNWYCWAVMLAVIVDAQPTVDETITCSTSTFEEVANDMVKLIASNQQEKAEEIKDDIKDVKTLLESESGQTNDTRLEEIVKEIKDVKQVLIPRPNECYAGSPSKQALVSALVCEYLLCFYM